MDKIRYYIYIQNNKINGKGLVKEINNKEVINFEVNEAIYNDYEKYTWNGINLILDPNYNEKQIQLKREKINKLFLTRADIERAIYKTKGMDFDDIIEILNKTPIENLDIKALKIELNANNFYRGNPFVDAIGNMLGFNQTQLDNFFTDGNYEHLLV